ncbi:MAG: hypothetical protein Q7S84_02310 [bacterium]|nr:hypothetical protein [bacterium]
MQSYSHELREVYFSAFRAVRRNKRGIFSFLGGLSWMGAALAMFFSGVFFLAPAVMFVLVLVVSILGCADTKEGEFRAFSLGMLTALSIVIIGFGLLAIIATPAIQTLLR